MVPYGFEGQPDSIFGGKYRLGRLLGGGEAAQVFLGEPTGEGEVVAIKSLRREHAPHRDRTERFRREADVLKRLQSPNVVRFHDYEESGGFFLISMEYVEGLALDVLRRGTTWVPPEIGILLLVGVARGLQAAHTEGIVHRDVRPANILLSRSGLPQLADFGIALVAGAERLTGVGVRPDRPDYRAPEVKRGQNADPRSDIYSLGVTACELLTQNLPHQSDAGAHLLTESLDPTLDPSRARQPAHKAAIARLVNAMLVGQPLQRYQSTAEFLENARLTLRQLDPTDSLIIHETEYLALFANTIFAEHPAQRVAWLEERMDRAASLWAGVNADTISELSACVRQSYFLNRDDPRVQETHRKLDDLLQHRPELLPNVPAGPGIDGGIQPIVLSHSSPPVSPGRLQVIPLGRKKAQLVWTPLPAEIDHVEVQRRIYPHVTFETIAQLIPSAGSYAVTGLTPGQSYAFRIRSVNRYGSSEWSNEEHLRTGSFPGWLVGLGVVILLMGVLGIIWWVRR